MKQRVNKLIKELEEPVGMEEQLLKKKTERERERERKGKSCW
jgi:hypothetical protein